MPRNQALRSKWLAAVPPPPHTWSSLLCPVSGVFLSSKPDLSQSKPVFVAYRRSLDGRVLAYSCTRAGARNGWLRFSGSGQRPWFSPRPYHIRSTKTASAALLGPEAGLCVHLPKHNCPTAMSTMGKLLIETSSSGWISSRAAMVRRVSAARDLIPEPVPHVLVVAPLSLSDPFFSLCSSAQRSACRPLHQLIERRRHSAVDRRQPPLSNNVTYKGETLSARTDLFRIREVDKGLRIHWKTIGVKVLLAFESNAKEPHRSQLSILQEYCR
ncbi:hypothetical protein CEP54_005085 [Fusarium duplospermum]|uniref:Uncharacterized protein n=1 Tax=Fusarium duplospermum TaxID=1325734 RepID=A0A428QEV8_9HYPO|nr:hypothetical protein CEP54_005085 [Fusarium duplospermum]